MPTQSLIDGYRRFREKNESDREVFEEPGCAVVPRSVALSTSRVDEGTGKEGLAGAGGPGNDEVVVMLYPPALAKA